MVSIRNSYRPGVVATVQAAISAPTRKKKAPLRTTRTAQPRTPRKQQASTCEKCGIEFFQPPHATYHKRYCSRSCSAHQTILIEGVSTEQIVAALPTEEGVFVEDLRVALGVSLEALPILRRRLYDLKNQSKITAVPSSHPTRKLWRRAC